MDLTNREDVHWEQLTILDNDVEATMFVELLQTEGIPALKQSPTAGVFGYGFSASTPEGYVILVPSDRIEEAREHLRSRPEL